MRKKVLSLLLAAALAGSSVTTMAADLSYESDNQEVAVEAAEEYDDAEEVEEAEGNESEEISEFDEALDKLYSESTSITDEEIFETAEEMPSEYALLEGRSDAAEIRALIEAFEEEKSEYLSGQTELSYSGTTGEELARQKYYSLFNIGSSNTLVSITPKVQVQDVREDGESLFVDLYEWVTEGYQTEGSDIVNAGAYGFELTLELTKSDESWQITGVSGTESNYSALEADGVIFTADGIEVDDSLVSAEEEAAYEEDVLVGASKGLYPFEYDASAAAAYADKWAMSYNPAYPNFKRDNVDCANFVSQCLYAGGIPLTYRWNIKGTTEAYVNWVNNSALHDYLVNYGFGTHVENPTSADLKAGDLVFYKWKRTNSRTNHVTIVVGKNASGVPVIDSHTNARYHTVWNYGYSTTKHTAIQMKKSDGREVKVEGAKAVYRLYSTKSGEHLYTMSKTERDYLIRYSWNYEGVAWYAPESSNTPIYRIYDSKSGKHHYTTSEGEKNYLVDVNGWTDEGIFTYSDDREGIAIYRVYNSRSSNFISAHHFTKDANERRVLISLGWTDEGIAWYGVDPNAPDEDPKDEDSKDEDPKDEDSKDEDPKDEDSKDEDSKDDGTQESKDTEEDQSNNSEEP